MPKIIIDSFASSPGERSETRGSRANAEALALDCRVKPGNDVAWKGRVLSDA